MWELDHFEQEGLIIYEHHWYYVLFAGGGDQSAFWVTN